MCERERFWGFALCALRHVVAAEPGWRWAWTRAGQILVHVLAWTTITMPLVLIVTGAVEFVAYPVDGRVYSRRRTLGQCLHVRTVSAVSIQCRYHVIEMSKYIIDCHSRNIEAGTFSRKAAEPEDMRHSHAQAGRCSFHDDFTAVRAVERDIWIVCETTTPRCCETGRLEIDHDKLCAPSRSRT